MSCPRHCPQCPKLENLSRLSVSLAPTPLFLQNPCPPSLTYLRLHDSMSNDFSPGGALTSLVKADIDIYRADEERDVFDSCSVLEFVGAMSNVRSLRLSISLMEADDDDDDNDSAFSDFLTMKFHNLTSLQLLKADWRFVSFFLENANNFQVLNIRMFDRRIKKWTEPNQVAVCVSSHLREVTIRDFGSKEGEFELVSYLLRNGKVMKRMEIYFDFKHGDGELDAVKRISKCCRASDVCELVFH